MHTVLIADDDNISLEVLKAMLSGYPLDVLSADNGQQAIQLAKESHPDLIILDYDMPELTGADVCRELRTLPDFQTLPIVALTGHQSVSELNACRSAGMDATLHKPVSPDAIAGLLREHLNL